MFLQVYKDMYSEEKKRYDEEMADWKASMSAEAWDQLMEKRTAERIELKKKKEKKKLKKVSVDFWCININRLNCFF